MTICTLNIVNYHCLILSKLCLARFNLLSLKHLQKKLQIIIEQSYDNKAQRDCKEYKNPFTTRTAQAVYALNSC